MLGRTCPRVALSCLVCLAAACSNGTDDTSPPGAGGWSPGTVYPSDQTLTSRGFLDLRGIIHAHSVYSHDACDGEPIDAAGHINQSCFEDFRRAICQVQHDFVMLSDHADSFADHEYPDVLLYDATKGDELLTRGGEPVANRAGCPDGFSVMILAGTETGTMPVGLEHHVGGDPASRHAVYGEVSAEAIQQLKDAGAVALLMHTEDWTIDDLTTLPIDGFEMFNLHANMYLAAGDAMGLIAKQKEPELLPHPDLVFVPLIKEDDAYLTRWAGALSAGVRRVTTMATDCHQNTFKQVLPDGERIDGYRRMMLGFSNHLLIRQDAGKWDDRSLKDALRAGRVYGVFEYMGYAQGFDYYAEQAGSTMEMGQSVSVAAHPTLHVRRPVVRDLDPSVTPPEVRVRLLRADGENWDEVAANAGDVSFEPAAPGAYRAEVRIVPRHLEKYLSSYAELAGREFVWVYSNAIYVEE